MCVRIFDKKKNNRSSHYLAMYCHLHDLFLYSPLSKDYRLSFNIAPSIARLMLPIVANCRDHQTLNAELFIFDVGATSTTHRVHFNQWRRGTQGHPL
ncbi:uncharacterized protein DS421_7g211090 [Arachis hypogaea]|nr:uncharacterized protein DS421_7g211090 [Arachis hypogaea]